MASIIQIFRKQEIGVTPSNLPTACTLDGRKCDLAVFEESFLKQSQQAYVYFENTSELYKATPAQLVAYLSKKEPWEDYDICIFDSGMKWCIGVTHNDDIVLSEKS